MRIAIAFALSLLAVGCDSGNNAAPSKDPPPKSTAAPAATTAKTSPKPQKPLKPELLDPSLSKEQAPDSYKVKFETTKGAFVVEVTRDWAPNGADRLYNLVKIGYFEDIALFRVVDNFVVQFGIHGDPRVAKKWQNANIAPDEVKESNKKGTLTYAMAGRPDTRSTQLFINLGDNDQLDKMGFAPVGKVIEGMDVVESFYKGYGERTTREQGNIVNRGNDFLRESYPKLDYIKSASLVSDAEGDQDAGGGDAPKGADDKGADAKDADGKAAPAASE